MNYYICSYGGCGSKCLMRYLKNFGNVKHVHSRKPPDKLQYIGKEKGGNAYEEHFNGIEIPKDELKNYIVIYIYKNPINAIYSRFLNPEHLKNIECNSSININDILNSKKDLYGIEEFYKNYTTPNKNRNYNIISVNYNTIFENIDELNKILHIKSNIKLQKKETKYNIEHYDELYKIYEKLINDMNKNSILII